MTWTVVEITQRRTVVVEAPDDDPAVLDVTGPVVNLEVAGSGLQGPAGPSGAPGSGGDTYFLYDRAGVPAATWTIDHGLGRPVHVTILDDSGAEADTDITHTPDLNTVVATFAAPTTGTAIVS